MIYYRIEREIRALKLRRHIHLGKMIYYRIERVLCRSGSREEDLPPDDLL